MIARHKQTGEIIEIYRVWGGKYQDCDKHSYSADELEFDNPKDKTEQVVWVARDYSGFIYAYSEEPRYDSFGDVFSADGNNGIYLGYLETLPDIKPGEKRIAKMTISL